MFQMSQNDLGGWGRLLVINRFIKSKILRGSACEYQVLFIHTCPICSNIIGKNGISVIAKILEKLVFLRIIASAPFVDL